MFRTDEEYQRLWDLAIEIQNRKPTKEEALRVLQRCGHLDENGNFTPPYAILEDYIVRKD